jgi:hypothetical protein
LNLKRLAFDDVIVPATALTSNPIPVPTAATKLFIDVKYTKGTEDGMVLTLEYADEVKDPWRTVGDIGGAPAPGKNAALAFAWVLSATSSWLLAIPQHLVAQGDYRLSLIRDGIVASTGKVTAYLKTGEA